MGRNERATTSREFSNPEIEACIDAAWTAADAIWKASGENPPTEAPIDQAGARNLAETVGLDDDQREAAADVILGAFREAWRRFHDDPLRKAATFHR